MAVGTKLAVRPTMLVIELVTREAILRRPLVAFIGMATLAAHARMPTRERKLGTLVVETDHLPGGFIVAAFARRPQSPLVPVVTGMTRRASDRRLRELVAALVTRRARDLSVRTLQRIIREAVVEIVPVKRCQVRIAPFVLAVALAAGSRAHLRVTTVKTCALHQLSVCFLVAVAAPCRLRLLVERDVAVLAVLTELFMLLVEVARRHHPVNNVRTVRNPACPRKPNGNQDNGGESLADRHVALPNKDARQRYESPLRLSARTAVAHAGHATARTFFRGT